MAVLAGNVPLALQGKTQDCKDNWNPDNESRSKAEGAKPIVEVIIWEIKTPAPGATNTEGGSEGERLDRLLHPPRVP